MEWDAPVNFALDTSILDLPTKTFEIEAECTCEACMQIHYFKKHLRCEETWMESTEYCICATCQTRRTMGGLFANVTPTSGCICKACREIRNRNK